MKSLNKTIKHGSTVALVNVAAPEPAEFPDRIAEGTRKLESMGLRVVKARHLMEVDGFFSAPPELVARDFNELWARDDVDAIICAGGGIAANALLPHLDFELFKRRPKPLVGASNPTILLNAIAKLSDISTFHGPSIVWDFGDNEQPQFTIDNFMQFFIKGSEILGEVPDFLVEGSAEGKSFGGNLSSLLLLSGTKYFPRFEGGVLVWEDIGESSDRIYSKLIQLEQMGILQLINGMIVGELIDCSAKADLDCRDIVQEVCAKYSFPIAWGVPFGHTSRKVIIPIGADIKFSSEHPQISMSGVN